MQGKTSDSDSLIKEYVQNLLDIVSEQLNQHRMEIETIDKLNHVTLRRQNEILDTLTPIAEMKEESKDVEMVVKTAEEEAQTKIEVGLTEVEASVN